MFFSKLTYAGNMVSLQSHLTVLELAAARFPSLDAFAIAQKSDSAGDVQTWQSISYSQFSNDVEVAASYWSQTLMLIGTCEKSTIGLWYAHYFLDEAAY